MDNGTGSDLQAEFYERIYPQLTAGGSQGRYHAFTHRLLEKPFPDSASFPTVLEVGAGTGEHLPFVRHQFDEYVMSDVRDASPEHPKPRVRFVQTGAESLPFEDDSFDRVLATCLLHHLREPMRALDEWRRVTRPGGVVSVMIAADPGMTFRAVRAVTSARKIRRLGFEHGATLHALEHRNHAGSLHQMIGWAFRRDELTARGFPLRRADWWNVNLLSVYHAKVR